jgi:hypothetical protein
VDGCNEIGSKDKASISSGEYFEAVDELAHVFPHNNDELTANKYNHKSKNTNVFSNP